MIHRTLTVILTSAILGGLIAPAALGSGPDIRLHYTSTLDELGVTYDVWDVATQGDPSANDLMDHEMVIWFTGYPRSDTFTSVNEEAVATYLDAGGRFCLVSEDYLYDRGLTSFGQSRLRIGSYTNDVNWTDPVGNAGHSLGSGLGPYNLTAPAGWPGDLYTDNVNNSGG